MEKEANLPLEYTLDWIKMGIVTPERIAEQEREYATGDDRSKEHYRWRSFCAFFERRQSLSPELAQQLFMLGAHDADRVMGGAIMAEVLRHDDCPEDLLRSCLNSDRKHLKRIAEKRLVR